MTRWDDERVALDAMVGELGAGLGCDPRLRVVALIDDDSAAVASWQDHDLASMAENRLRIDVDPRAIEAETRADWVRRATEDGRLYRPSAGYGSACWVSWDGERVGTVALAAGLGSGRCALSSLYVRPDRRGQGVARAVLDAILGAAQRHGLDGVRLETSWCWSPAVRFYARRGLWVRGWKRELSLVECRTLPAYRTEIEGDVARFS